ncbi:hypothetical protein M427DRAFT_64321 [Gonapodya prolifera JEL478]|uniref:Uncharacterized protein n=1 Tax=Gonapodya prolifera (strain JEL478) TaxID=1344416 RepID=A0A138ZXP5_GONPJ|nr:hypothetical protein M427DRAFT_64321 [Gonapodya prolifera JEL478]|eukprot:KXS09282.1 hypothetical protein M427DRAFT_64321 [Gonapodya prolifera JEL478]
MARNADGDDDNERGQNSDQVNAEMKGKNRSVPAEEEDSESGQDVQQSEPAPQELRGMDWWIPGSSPPPTPLAGRNPFSFFATPSPGTTPKSATESAPAPALDPHAPNLFSFNPGSARAPMPPVKEDFDFAFPVGAPDPVNHPNPVPSPPAENGSSAEFVFTFPPPSPAVLQPPRYFVPHGRLERNAPRDPTHQPWFPGVPPRSA